MKEDSGKIERWNDETAAVIFPSIDLTVSRLTPLICKSFVLLFCASDAEWLPFFSCICIAAIAKGRREKEEVSPFLLLRRNLNRRQLPVAEWVAKSRKWKMKQREKCVSHFASFFNVSSWFSSGILFSLVVLVNRAALPSSLSRSWGYDRWHIPVATVELYFFHVFGCLYHVLLSLVFSFYFLGSTVDSWRGEKKEEESSQVVSLSFFPLVLLH